jgi:hypothetical protein
MNEDMDIADYAKLAITQPEDAWFGNDQLWYSHGMSGWNQHRDSEILERANFQFVTEELAEKFGDPDPDGLWWINHATHWAVGWVDQIMVRILEDPELPIEESNLTEIFKFCIELLEDQKIYTILDDSHYELLKEQALIDEVNQNFPRWANTSFDPDRIISLAYDYDLEIPDGYDRWMISPTFVDAATFVCGMFDDDETDDATTAVEHVLSLSNPNDYDTIGAQQLIQDFFSLVEISVN